MRDVAEAHAELDVVVLHLGVVHTDLDARRGPEGWLLSLVQRGWEAPEACARRLSEGPVVRQVLEHLKLPTQVPSLALRGVGSPVSCSQKGGLFVLCSRRAGSAQKAAAEEQSLLVPSRVQRLFVPGIEGATAS